jgi:uncharacterized cupredoxin-like copper-binding protein
MPGRKNLNSLARLRLVEKGRKLESAWKGGTMGSKFHGTRLATIAAVGLVMAFVPACSGDDGDAASPSDTTDTGTVAVTLQEFSVGAIPSTASAGTVTFNVSNTGPDDTHEFVVISTDLDPTELPTDKTGAVLETGEGMEVIDEIEDVLVDANETLSVDLEAGPYVLICNIYDKKEKESHYQEGMRTGFTVA